MHATDLIRRLHEHRCWVNQQLLRVAESLSEEQLHRRFEIGQGTIWLTLAHLYAAEYVWLQALHGDEDPVAPGDDPMKLPGNQQGDNPIASMGELKTRWHELDGEWSQYLNQLSLDQIDPVYKTSSLTGKRSGTQRSDILLHVCTHAQYTTAQLMNMFRHVCVKDLPDPMLITLARQQFEA